MEVMKRMRLVLLTISLVATGITGVDAQSKKEMIELLTRKNDSLEKALAAKTESLHQLEVKFAKMEGASGVHQELIKQLQSQSDSLRASLSAKELAIESLDAEKTKLTEEVRNYQALEKEWASKNEGLLAELQSFKDTTTNAKLNVISSRAGLVKGTASVTEKGKASTEAAKSAEAVSESQKAAVNVAEVKPEEAPADKSQKAD